MYIYHFDKKENCKSAKIDDIAYRNISRIGTQTLFKVS